jgi:hypothetical protein
MAGEQYASGSVEPVRVEADHRAETHGTAEANVKAAGNPHD